MIQHHGNFAVVNYPSNWPAPKFQFGLTVEVEGNIGRIIGLEYVTEATIPTGCNSETGWWYFVTYDRMVREKLIVDVIGHHESVIRPISPSSHRVLHGASPVSR